MNTIRATVLIALLMSIAHAGEKQLRRAELTGYCACVKCCGKTDGITASGRLVAQGRTLAMPKGIPFGTKVWQVTAAGNHFLGVCEDRGGAIVSKDGVTRIDVYFSTHKAALVFGRVKGVVILLEFPDEK